MKDNGYIKNETNNKNISKINGRKNLVNKNSNISKKNDIKGNKSIKKEKNNNLEPPKKQINKIRKIRKIETQNKKNTYK